MHFRLVSPTAIEEGEGDLELQEGGFFLIPNEGSAFNLPYLQLLSLTAQEQVIVLRFPAGELELSQLGWKETETAENLHRLWEKAVSGALYIRPGDTESPFRGLFKGSGFSEHGRAIPSSHLLLLFLEKKGLVIFPVRFWEKISFDPQCYGVQLLTRHEPLSCSKLGPRTKEFEDTLRGTFQKAKANISSLVGSALPDFDPFLRRRLTEELWEKMAWRKSELNLLDTWQNLRDRLLSQERASFVQALEEKAQGQECYLGIAQPPWWEEGAAFLSWFSARLKPQLFVLEISSAEEGYASYFFHLTQDEKKNEEIIADIHFFWPLFGFPRELINLSAVELGRKENQRSLFLLEHLPSLRFLRENFAGKVDHANQETWRKEIEKLIEGQG